MNSLNKKDMKTSNTLATTVKIESHKDTAGQTKTFGTRLNELTRKPKRHPSIHWAALILSIISLVPLIMWVGKPSQISSTYLYWSDIGLSFLFILEFITRSGFRWNPSGYTRSHFFDFIAIVPALVLVHFTVPFYSVWFWIIFIARVVRALDRILGDGFIPRNVLALAEGFEEEITDRVTLRILDRTKADLDRGKFATAIGDVLEKNKGRVLEEILEQHPRALETGIAEFVGLNKAIHRAEEQIYDAIIRFLKSPEIDKMVRDSIDSTFSVIRKGVAEKSWKKNLGFKQINAT
jgi:hypothetical protein